MLAQAPLSWWVERLRSAILYWLPLEIIQVARTTPKWPIERRGLAFGCKRMADAGPSTNFIVGWKVEANLFVVAALGNHTSSPLYSKMAHWKVRVGTVRHWKQNDDMRKWCESNWGARICRRVPWPFGKGTSHFIEIFWNNFQMFWGQTPSKYSVLFWVGAIHFLSSA